MTHAAWSRIGRWWRLLWAFSWLQLQSLVFAAVIFAAIALTAVVPLPIARYDALLIVGIALTLVLWAVGWESGREVLVILGFHLLGLMMEIFKVAAGSWAYPEDAVTKVFDVPLYSGFMYAAVGSYIVQAWRRFDLRVTDYRPVPLTILAAAAYLNFFTHHYIWDLRWVIVVLFLIEMRATVVHFTVAGERFRMPLAASFLLIGIALWVAENLATLLGAWQYPDQAEFWRAVHVGKVGSWALLVSLSFVLVATVKQFEGTLYGHPGDRPSVLSRHRNSPAADEVDESRSPNQGEHP